MKPRASAAAITLIPWLAKWSWSWAIDSANAAGWLRSGVMSLNMMPGLGKSGMSRM